MPLSAGDRFSKGLKIVQRIIAVIAVIAIAALLIRRREQIAGLFSIDGAAWFALGGVAFALGHLLVASGFHFLHRSIGVENSWSSALDSYLRRLPARYVPGGIWHALARYLDLRSAGRADSRALFRIFVFENGVVGLSGLVVASIATAVGFAPTAAPVVLRLLLAAATVALAVALFAFARFTRQRVAWRPFLIAVILHAINWTWLTCAFSIYARGLRDSTLLGCAAGGVAISYLLAAVTGFISFFAPQGWGVAEYVFALLQPCGAAVAVAVAALTGFRLVCLLADVILFIAWSAARKRNRPQG